MKLVPLGDRVVLKQCEAEETINPASFWQEAHRRSRRKRK